MKLFFKDKELGTIEEGIGDFPWFYGVIELTEEGKRMSDFLVSLPRASQKEIRRVVTLP